MEKDRDLLDVGGGRSTTANKTEGFQGDLIEIEEDAEQRATDENSARQNNFEADKAKGKGMRK